MQADMIFCPGYKSPEEVTEKKATSEEQVPDASDWGDQDSGPPRF